MTKNIQQHLQKIEDDQVVSGIDSVELTERNDAGRHFAISQMLQPVIMQGYYNEITGKYVLGSPKLPTTRSTVSSALNTPSVTLTCPAGHVYKVLIVSGDNDTTAPSWRVIYTPNGGVASQLVDSGTVTVGVNVTSVLLGGGAAALAGISSPSSIVGPLYMRPGDTLNVENTNDVAGDTITIVFVYEDYEEGV